VVEVYGGGVTVGGSLSVEIADDEAKVETGLTSCVVVTVAT